MPPFDGYAPLERTLVILKPDAVKRKLVGKILLRFKRAGLQVSAFKEVHATPKQLDGHFPKSLQWLRNMGVRAERRCREEIELDPFEAWGTTDSLEIGKKIVHGCREYYLSGPLTAVIVEGHGAVATVRKLIGNTLPSKAAPGTIRGDFGIHEDPKKFANGAARNLIHASDSPKEAEREIKAWFFPENIPR